MTNKAEQPTITQADIQAAEMCQAEQASTGRALLDINLLKRAFARHRTTSLAAQDGLVESLESALRISLWNEARGKGMTQDEAIKHVSDTVVAIKGDKS